LEVNAASSWLYTLAPPLRLIHDQHLNVTFAVGKSHYVYFVNISRRFVRCSYFTFNFYNFINLLISICCVFMLYFFFELFILFSLLLRQIVTWFCLLILIRYFFKCNFNSFYDSTMNRSLSI